jgi:uncharacterized membrane protein YfcA
MKWIHIVAGLLALAAGAIALYSRKGGTVHRKVELVFVYAMLVMAALGSVMAALKPDRLSSLGGVLTIYFVTSSLLTVRRPVEESRWMHTGAMLAAVTLGIIAIGFRLLASQSPKGRLDGFAATGVVRVLRQGRVRSRQLSAPSFPQGRPALFGESS